MGSNGLPGYWAVLKSRTVAFHPAGFQATLANFDRLLVAFESSGGLYTQRIIDYVPAFPMAHALAGLRFASRVTAPVARLTTEPGRLTIGQAAFARAGRLRLLGLITSFDPS